MQWSSAETERFAPVLRQLCHDLREARSIAVLHCGGGTIPLWLATHLPAGCIIGLEMDQGLLSEARDRAISEGLAGHVDLLKVEQDRIPLATGVLDALVSDLALFPSPVPAQIGFREMVRVLGPGRRLVLLDVILARPMPEYVRAQLRSIGLDYIAQARMEEYKTWMVQAGLDEIEILDYSALFRQVWDERCARDRIAWHSAAYDLLLQDSPFSLGKGIFYIYARGTRQ